jgi:hypothetical protein
VYAYEARGAAPDGREINARFVAVAVADEYVKQEELARPQYVNIYAGRRLHQLAASAIAKRYGRITEGCGRGDCQAGGAGT